jgi:hypothetical protein
MKYSTCIIQRRVLSVLLTVFLTLFSISQASAFNDIDQSGTDQDSRINLIPIIPIIPLLSLVSCPINTASPGGDQIDRGFYENSWPGYSLSKVDLHFQPTVAGSYVYQLTARRNTYDGELIGVATASVVFANTTDYVKVPFYFGNVLAYHGEKVTFKIEKISGSGSTYFATSSTNATCAVTETDGTSAPLSTFRRNGIAVTISGDFSAATPNGSLENPQPNSNNSGIGLVSGWVCSASKIEVQFNSLPRVLAAYGTDRGDTQSICGDADNGFGLLVNYNLLGNGTHTVKLFADNVQVASASFKVTTLGAEFRSGLSATYSLSNFPLTGQNVGVEWSQSLQNFVIRSYAP